MIFTTVRHLNSKVKDIHPDLSREDSFTTIEIFNVQEYPKTKGHKRSVECCFLTWFNIAYYSCVCPFRIRLRKDDGISQGKYYLHRNLIQQIICALAQATTILNIWNQLAEESSGLSVHSKNPIDFLQFLLTLILLLTSVVFTGHFWMKSKHYLHLIETLSSTDIVVNIWIIRLMCSVYFFASAILSVYTLATTKTCELSLLTPTTTHNALKCLLLNRLVTENLILNSLVEYLTYFLDLLRAYSIVAQGLGPEGLVLMISLTAYHVGVNLTKIILKCNNRRNQHQNEFVNVLNEYERLKLFYKKLNEAVHLILFCYVLIGMLYYATNLKDVLGFSLDSNLFIMYYFFNFSLILCLAAEASRQTESMKLWLTQPEVRDSLSESHLAHLRYEVQVNPLGLSGYRIFIINYDFLASFIGCLMTYFIITLQFNN